MGIKAMEWNQREKALNRVLLFGVYPQRETSTCFFQCDGMTPENSWAFKSLSWASFMKDLGRKDRWEINWKRRKPDAVIDQSKTEYAQCDLKMVQSEEERRGEVELENELCDWNSKKRPRMFPICCHVPGKLPQVDSCHWYPLLAKCFWQIWTILNLPWLI